MANIINQLEISGITYDIQDNDAQNALLTKQDALVSGVNIKTINNESLLGSGNIDIQGGTGDAYTKAETDALLADKADVSAVTSAVTEFSAALGNEIQRAQGVEQVLSGAIDTKVDSNDVYLKSSTSSSTEINNALETKADASTTYSKTEVDTAINAATSGKADTSAVTSAVSEFSAALSGEIQRAMAAEQTISGAVDTKANSRDVYLKSETSSSTEINNALQAKADASTTYSKSEVDTAINAATSGKADTSAVTAAINAATSGKADTSAVTSAVSEFTTALSGEIQRAQGVEQALSGAIDGKQATLVSGTNIKTINNQSLLGSGNITIQGGGGANVVELTQAQYDALATKDPDTFYIISDATPIDTSTFYTTAQTSSSTQIATALSGKQNTLTAGSGIDISNDVISVTGGGGGSYTAGRGISISDDVISFSLPLSAGTGNNSVIGGLYTSTRDAGSFAFGISAAASGYTSCAFGRSTSSSDYSIAAGQDAHADGFCSVAFGRITTAKCNSESSFGAGNISNGNTNNAFGHSGNTLFSVGNGLWSSLVSNRHNALEIRQNGDIYYADTNNTTYQNYYEKPMIKLQDKFDEIDSIIGDINTILSSL